MKPTSRWILIVALLVLSIIAVVPVSASRLSASTVFQSPPATNTPLPPATNTPLPPATNTPLPPATNTPLPPATNTPIPAATNTPAPVATSTPLPPLPTATPIPPYLPPPPYYLPPSATYGILGYHIVRPGETLYCISRAYQVSPWAIASVNYIRWPYYVYIGQQLAIPNAPWYNIPPGPVCLPQFGGAVPTPTPAPPTSTPNPNVTPTVVPPPTCRFYHFVRPGQTLYGISLFYGVNMYTIAAANNIVNLNLIYAFTYLCIP